MAKNSTPAALAKKAKLEAAAAKDAVRAAKNPAPAAEEKKEKTTVISVRTRPGFNFPQRSRAGLFFGPEIRTFAVTAEQLAAIKADDWLEIIEGKMLDTLKHETSLRVESGNATPEELEAITRVRTLDDQGAPPSAPVEKIVTSEEVIGDSENPGAIVRVSKGEDGTTGFGDDDGDKGGDA